MKRSPFIRKAPLWAKNKPLNQPETYSYIGLKAIKSVAKFVRRGVMVSVNDAVFAQPKANPIQHGEYMRFVRLLPCMNCGIDGYTQFCHSDAGKGMAIKSDCRTGWPGCGPRPGIAGCHALIGSTGRYTQAERRLLEAQFARQTRTKIIDLGLWPKNLPVWPEGPE